MTPCSRPIEGCPDCGDTLIHQSNRQEHESSSEFGQYMHDRGERERRWREIYWLDVDGAVYKKRTGILRIIEHKNNGGVLRDSQRHVFPLLAKALQLLAATGLIDRQSGVFVVWSNHPHDTAVIEQQAGWSRIRVMTPREMSGPDLEEFLLGEPIPDAIGGRAA